MPFQVMLGLGSGKRPETAFTQYCIIKKMAKVDGDNAVQLSKSRAINNSRFNRALTITALRLCKKWKPWRGSVLFLTPRICVKASSYQDLAEAATMQFIAQNTKIPVPKVYCAFQRKGTTYTVMERLDGEMFGHQWSQRSDEAKAKGFLQLRDMIASMRELEPPKGAGVENIFGESLFDERLPGTSMRFGPFKGGVPDFHKHLRTGIETHDNPEVHELIQQHESRQWPLRFTHADLSSLNIIVRGDNVIGIVDWETAGWYPSYWEYTTARDANPQNMFWGEQIDNFLSPMPEEWAMETLRRKLFW